MFVAEMSISTPFLISLGGTIYSTRYASYTKSAWKTCRPYGTQRTCETDPGFYTHIAPTELKTGVEVPYFEASTVVDWTICEFWKFFLVFF
jgi:hypothetical protein